MRNKILLHTCCGPCVIYPIEKLKESYSLTLFFYNPNIHPEEEYEKRLKEAKKVADYYRVPLILAPYEREKWLEMVKGWEEEKEGGKRCEVCFTLRLRETARFAKKEGFLIFGTTLTSGRQKNAELINRLGREIAAKEGLDFLIADFKEGFQVGLTISKKLSLYRQKYCGCIYSQKGSG
ncbi:MAG: epoxyqueuosine reductase QueH [candidate division WOR-3 bacterium]